MNKSFSFSSSVLFSRVSAYAFYSFIYFNFFFSFCFNLSICKNSSIKQNKSNNNRLVVMMTRSDGFRRDLSSQARVCLCVHPSKCFIIITLGMYLTPSIVQAILMNSKQKWWHYVSSQIQIQKKNNKEIKKQELCGHTRIVLVLSLS